MICTYAKAARLCNRNGERREKDVMADYPHISGRVNWPHFLGRHGTFWHPCGARAPGTAREPFFYHCGLVQVSDRGKSFQCLSHFIYMYTRSCVCLMSAYSIGLSCPVIPNLYLLNPVAKSYYSQFGSTDKQISMPNHTDGRLLSIITGFQTGPRSVLNTTINWKSHLTKCL